MVKMNTRVINGRLKSSLDEFVQERVELVLGKFEGRIESIDVCFKGEAQRKDAKKVCTIDVRLTPRGRVRVSAKGDNYFSAVLSAIHSAELQILKDLRKHQRGHNLRHRKQGLRQENRQWAAQLASAP